MGCGALCYMSFLRTMDPSLRWDDEFYYVGKGPKADASMDYFIGLLVLVIPAFAGMTKILKLNNYGLHLGLSAARPSAYPAPRSL
jgi:hypothetical protein